MRTRLASWIFAAGLLPSVVALAQTAPAGQAPANSLLPKLNELEVKKPDALTEQELRVLRSLEGMSVEKLTQLLQVYERLDNTAMLDAVVRAILHRDPKNAEAIRVRDEDSLETTRPAGYLDGLAAKVMAGERVDDTDAVPLQSTAWILEGRAADAVRLLEKLRSNQYAGKVFPYLDDLGYAYTEAGRLDDAEAAYKAVISDLRLPQEARQEAVESLPRVALKKQIVKIRDSGSGNPDKLLAAAAQLSKERPNDDDVLAFRIECFEATRRYDDAVAFLLDLRKRYTGPDPWPWLSTLGHCYHSARRFDEAVATFKELQTTPGIDDASRMESETMILEIQVGREVERGTFALMKGDLKTGASVLEKLEANYKSHRDVLGFRALYFAKTGRADEALRMLYQAKRKEEAQNLPFSQQDALADVYMELKQYDQAREAVAVVLKDPRYDPEMRAQAMAQLQDIFIAESLQGGYKALEDGHRAKARAIAGEMRAKAPYRIEVRMFEAEVALSYFNARFARDELSAIKAATTGDEVFAGQNSLADALAQTGNWEGAWAAYGEVLDNPGYDRDDKFEALWERRALAPWFKPTVSISNTTALEDEGSAFRDEFEYSSSWVNRWRFFVFARNYTTRLKGDSLLQGRRDSHFEGGVRAQRRLGDDYFVEAEIGASDEDPIYGVRVGKFAYHSFGWSLGFKGNAMSNDSVNLQALNGRENRVEFRAGGPISDRWVADFEAYYQWSRVGGSRLGEGYGASGSLDYVIQTETRRRPEITIGYFFEYSRFDRAGSLPPRVQSEIRRAVPATQEVRKALATNEEVKRALAGDFGSEVFDSLVDPYTNRHGIMLKVRKHFDNNIAISGQLGAYYGFDEGSVQWTASAALEYWVSESTMVYAELRYDSAGKGASSGAGVWEANIGGQMTF